MKFFVLFASLFIFSTPTLASDSQAYNNCILQHVGKSKIKWVTQLVKRACKDNSKKIFAPKEEERAYNDCILENLPGVEEEEAAKSILKSCKDNFD